MGKAENETVFGNFSKENLARFDYCSFCENDEIDRILNPRDAKDYLLQRRAEIVADHMRYRRVYMNRLRVYKSFEKSFRNGHYLAVLEKMSPDDKEACKEITYGDMFSNDVNGYAENNKDWGRLIYLNESLRYYINFSNLAILDYEMEVPDHVRKNALRIAIRTLLKNEAMDFDMDPRGICPDIVGEAMIKRTRSEMQYIAGHEFAHHLCGHFNNAETREFLNIDGIGYSAEVYNIDQKKEFEADIQSITRPYYLNKEQSDLIISALVWFKTLELGETAIGFFCPCSPLSYNTHPSAKDRYLNIIEHFGKPKERIIESIEERVNSLKEFLLEDLSENCENYEVYGSVYLDRPNTKWRGKELVDRVDYY